MGFSFRRSSSFGPFRLNFSKSAIGASVGVKGARDPNCQGHDVYHGGTWRIFLPSELICEQPTPFAEAAA